jgi:sterol desaturase/sphingolipid hydroxylase (fatty acid hydroxylase superfamily)
VRNVAIGASGALAVLLIEQPIAGLLARRAERRGWGVLGWLPLSGALRSAAALLLLDYTLFVWHYLTHRIPLLWRFHAPHHLDLDLDASTGLRFHFGELALSTAWRSAQVVLIGVSPGTLRIWQAMTLASVVFHHSNLELSPRIAQAIEKLFVTPRMHAIHHSVRSEEQSSNWSSGLSLWDRLHGTLRTVALGEFRIGLEGHDGPRDVGLMRVLWLPFRSRAAAPRIA